MATPIMIKDYPSYPGKQEGPMAVAIDSITSVGGPIVGTIMFDGTTPERLAPTEVSVPLKTSTLYVTAPLTNTATVWVAASSAVALAAFNNTGNARRSAGSVPPGQTTMLIVDDLLDVFALGEDGDLFTFSGG